MTIIEERAKLLDDIVLKHGQHASFDDGVCLLELESWLAGEPFSDHPECVCPVLGAFGRAWNDALDDEARNRILRPFRGRLIGTRSTPEVQDARAFMAADWAVRTYTPAWLRLAGLDAEAAQVEALPVLSSAELCKAAMPTIRVAQSKAAAAGAAAWDAARAAARDAARAAAGDAAWAAAWDAARAAARDAARAAARAAAGAAAWDAAWAAARDAAWDAARAAAGDAAWAAARAAARDAAWAAARTKLQPVTELLQASAADLFDRMINLTEVVQRLPFEDAVDGAINGSGGDVLVDDGGVILTDSEVEERRAAAYFGQPDSIPDLPSPDELQVMGDLSIKEALTYVPLLKDVPTGRRLIVAEKQTHNGVGRKSVLAALAKRIADLEFGGDD